MAGAYFLKFGVVGFADFCCITATGPKTAAAGRINRAWYIPLKYNPFALSTEFRVRNRYG